MNILDVGAMYGYPCANIFGEENPTVLEVNSKKPFDPKLLDRLDLIIFGGGQDVCPALYGHRNVASHCSDKPSDRDLWEQDLFKLNAERNYPVPMLGICRGAQFLCVMNGGWLIQDVDNHAGHNHEIHLTMWAKEDGHSIVGNSYHHQMMVPGRKGTLLGFTTDITKHYLFDTEKVGDGFNHGFNPEANPEIVFYSGTNSLCFQPHPEYLHSNAPLSNLTRKYTKRLLGVGK